MSEDLQVQQTPQQRGNYAVPGLIAGGAIGGAGGVIAANKGFGIQTKPDLDKVFAQKPDVFDKKIENAEGEIKTAWETVRDAVKPLQDKKAEFDEKVKYINDELAPKLKEYSAEIEKKAKELANGGEITEEIKKQAKDAIKDTEIYKNYENALIAAKEKIGQIVKNDNGKVLLNPEKWIEALGKKEDYIKTVNEAATEKIKPLLDKLKLPSKTWTGIAAGAALALAGLLIGAASKKDEA